MTDRLAKLAYSVDEAAEVSSLSRSVIDREIRAGNLQARAGGQKGGKALILADDLLAYLRGLPAHEPRRAS